MDCSCVTQGVLYAALPPWRCRALMTISGARDGLFTIESMKGAIRTLERTCEKAGIRERYRGDLDDTPHEFNAAMQQRARAWLDRWLRT